MFGRLTVQGGPRDACWRAFTLAALALVASSAAQAEDAPACAPDDATQVRLNVTVSGLHSARGLVTITVYPDDASRFLASGGKLARQRIRTVLPETRACFVAPAPGHYAVFAYHDENGDRKINFSWLGHPSEGLGFSNNPKLRDSRPPLAEVRFEANTGDNAVPVRIVY
jgi:uncharacterized protein (DUF2141 family)